MVIDRRRFASGLMSATAGVLLPLRALGQEATETEGALFAAARKDSAGVFYASIFDLERGIDLARVRLPARGHDIAVRPRRHDAPSGPRECIAFARRPGNFAVVFSADTEREPVWLTTPEGRHFYGHGVFSGDGQLLYTTENDYEAGRGIIGVYDVDAGYRRIGEFLSGGIGPHDIALLSDGRTIVVANGGIQTHPVTPRVKLNLASMRPNLAYVDTNLGEIFERHELPQNLHQLSIRHLDVGTNDTVIFGCQYQGARWKTKRNVGRHQRGSDIQLLELPQGVVTRMRNYVASVAVNADGSHAIATSPRSGLAVVIEVQSGRYVASLDMENVFGVAARPDGRGFGFTSGYGDIGSWSGKPDDAIEAVSQNPHKLTAAWDNHLIAVR